MRPTFMGFETARRGLMANQKGIDVSGHNLTNINTNGYTRQRVDYVSVQTGSTGRYGVRNGSLAGQGVNVNGVSQIRDSFLDKRFREEYSDVGFYDQNVASLSDIESALDEVTSKGLKEGIKNMVIALNNFSKNPDQSTHANIVMTEAKNLTQVLRQFDGKLQNILEQQKFSAEIAVNDVNSLTERIANLNKGIAEDVFLSGGGNEYYGPNELLDQRNVLIDELSRYGEVSTVQETDGTVTVEMNGTKVVDGKKYETMNYVENSDNTISINWQSTGKEVKNTTGVLTSYINMINGRGSEASGANENFEKGVPYYQDKIDAFAKQIVSVFNNTIETKATNAEYQVTPTNTVFPTGAHTITVDIGGINYNATINVPADGNNIKDQSKAFVAQLNTQTGITDKYNITSSDDGTITFTAKEAGVDTALTGITGYNATNTFKTTVAGMEAGEVTKTLFEPGNAGEVTAGNITISDQWMNDPNYIITDMNGDGESDNTYILALINTFNEDYNFGEFEGTFEEYVNYYNTTLGQEITFNSTRLEASASIADEMLNRRDAISGVSMDEEGANLMTYDKAYKAVSRLMTTLDEALDTLINKTGLVGR